MGSTRRNVLTLAVACAVIAGFGTYGAISASTSRADSVGPIDFESYSLGSVNGQDGWSSTGGIDQAIVSNGGNKSPRISDAVTSGSFGDQTFSKPTVNAAGEPGADAGAFPVGTLQSKFSGSFDLAAATPGVSQGSMHMQVSPDRGDGARMSYLRIED